MRGLVYLMLILSICTTLNASTIEVCTGCKVSSLKDALLQASDGDEILLQAGYYRESNIIVDKRVMIRGKGMPVLDANFVGEILTVTADSVTIEGIEFRNAGKSHIKDLAAIRIQRQNHFIIRNNRIINAFFGIYIERGKYGLIEGNVLIGEAKNEMTSGNAIHCWYADYLTIRHNSCKKYRDGIYLEFVNNSEISDNWSENNIRYGLHFMFSNDDSYTCNTFRANGAGVAVMFSKRIQMIENVFEYNWGRAAYGLLLKEIYDANIQYNLFQQNTIGILLEGSTRLQYKHNTFSRNGWAIQMSGGCLDNTFSQNNFLTNALDLVVKSRVNNNTFDGNFWSDYSGYDLDKDGAGDVPHRPVKLYAYVLTKSPESIVLLRSFFIDLLNFSEKVSPVFTPENVLDNQPLMKAIS
ncbi:MAG: nitrous oxide reductase family maturation protein NosD [Saprospiraceae bacterium]